MTANVKLPTNEEVEAASRAEATAILIRLGYRVYRPEADCYGEDLIIRFPGTGELRPVQLKSRPTVDLNKYRSLWMLFPDPDSGIGLGRKWFLVPHDKLYEWMKEKHGHAPKWKDAWHYPKISNELRRFLDEFALITSPFNP
jgi:hypothetical protein